MTKNKEVISRYEVFEFKASNSINVCFPKKRRKGSLGFCFSLAKRNRVKLMESEFT